MKILFQGDSITDCGRDRSDPKNIGPGYVKYAAEHICEMFPQKEFEFYNLGIGGNQTKDLVARLETDFIDIQPDLVSILIGINDVWHNANNGGNWLSNDDFECRYRAVLKAIKERTNAKIVMLEPFLFPAEDKQCFRVDLDPKIQVIRKLAREYADVYIPTDGLLAARITTEDWKLYSADGVHLIQYGSQVVGKMYADAVYDLIKSME